MINYVDENYELIDNLLEDLTKLCCIKEKNKCKALNVYDFDDTLYSRKEQLKNPLLAKNRGESGNMVILEKMGGYKRFVERFYEKQGITEDFITIIKDNIKNKINLILTAGDEEFQRLKVEKVGLSFLSSMIVKKSCIKPMALFKYILYELEAIPEKIEIYDDRVEYFNQNAQFLTNLLGVEITIYKVKLNGKIIDKIEVNNYNPKKESEESLDLELLYKNIKNREK